MNSRKAYMGLLAVLLLSLLGCGGDAHVSATLDSAETLMTESPDSSLTLLESIDPTTISSKAERARYALLLTQAQDKNYIEEMSDSLISYAVDYYASKGDEKRLLPATYYKGRVLFINHEYPAALQTFMQSLRLAESVDDKFYASLSARGIADIYGDNLNFPEELAYATKEYESMRKLGRQPYLNYAILDLTRARLNSLQTDSVILIATSLLDSAYVYQDPNLYGLALRYRYLSFYDQERYTDAIADISMLAEMGMAAPRDSAMMISALIRTNDIGRAKEIMGCLSLNDPGSYYLARYNVEKHDNRLDSAMACLEISTGLADKLLRERVSEGLTSIIYEYDRLSLQKAEADVRNANSVKLIMALIVVIVLLASSGVIYYINMSHQREIEEKLAFAEKLQILLSKSQSENTISSDRVKKLLSSQNALIEEICQMVVKKTSDKKIRTHISDKIQALFDQLQIADSETLELEQQANAVYDNIMADFREALPDLSEKDYRLFLFTVMRFSNVAISLFIKEPQIKKVYDRRYRLKNKISQLPAERATYYLSFFEG